MDGVKRGDWDIDLRFGLQGEETVSALLQDPTIEVKTDRRWIETGNVYIETWCWSHNNHNWYPGGILGTKAKYWAFNLEGTILILETEKVKRACELYGRPSKCAIPPNYSHGFLVRATELLNIARNG